MEDKTFYLLKTISTIAADDLAMEGAKASAAMVLA